MHSGPPTPPTTGARPALPVAAARGAARARARRVALWTVGALAGLLAAFLAVGETSGWRWLRAPLQDALARASGVPVRLNGRFDARLLWQPHIEVEQLTVGAAGGIEAPHLLDGRDVALDFRWGDLWRWQRGEVLRLRALQAGALDLRLLRADDGRATWQLGRSQREPPPERSASHDSLPRIGVLAVQDGRIVVDDQMSDTQLNIALHGLEAEGAVGPAASGYRAHITGRYRALPLDLELHSGSALPLLRDDGEAGEQPMSTLLVKGHLGAARVSFDGHAASLLSARRLEGALQFAGPSLAAVGGPLGVTLPQTPAFQLNGRLAHDRGLWSLVAERVLIGGSHLAGDFRYDTRRQPARLSGHLNGPRLMLADLGPSIGARTGGTPAQPSPPQPQAQGRVLPQRRFDLPSLRAMDADVQVAVDELVFSTSAMAPMRGLRTRVLLSSGVLELQSLKANVAGGRVAGATRLDTTADPPQWRAQLNFDGVDIAGWVRGVRKPAVAQAAPPAQGAQQLKQQRDAARQRPEQAAQAYVTGALDAQFDVAGAGRSTAEILASMDGRSQMTLRDGTLSHLATELLGLDLAQALGVMIRGDRPLALRCARFDFAIEDGVMKTQRGVLDNRDSTIRVAGSVDLRNEALSLVARVRPKDFSPLSLRAPVTVTGTLDEPVVGVQGRQLTGRVLGAVILGSLVTPLAALLPLFDKGAGDEPDPCAQPPATASAVNVPRPEPTAR